MNLVLRPVRVGDEHAFRAAHAAMAAQDHFEFGLLFDENAPFDAYVERLALNARGIDLPRDRVPDTFLVAHVDGKLVGRTSIRHRLNDFLEREGGHIGYGVVAAHRGKGYATEILRQSLIVARSLGVADALLFCEDDNLASARAIQKCGGVLEGRPTSSSGATIRRYVIAL